jgi:hypothetical protein
VLSNNADLRNTEFHNAPMLYSVFFHPAARDRTAFLIYISGYINGYG